MPAPTAHVWKPVLKSVASGEKAYGVVVDYMPIREKAKGAPVDFVFPKEGVSAVSEPEPASSTTDDTAISGFSYGANVIRKPLFLLTPFTLTSDVPVLQATFVFISENTKYGPPFVATRRIP
mgnify:CR=1 FL=1